MPRLIKYKNYPTLLKRHANSAGQEYSDEAISQLKLYLDLDTTITDRAGNLGNPTLSYDGTTNIQKFEKGSVSVNTAFVDDSENINAKVVYSSTSNPISFGDGSNDSPFSVSLIYKRNSATADNTDSDWLFSKGNGSSAREYYAVVTANKIYFTLYDESANTYLSIYSNIGSNALLNDHFSHLAFTYDGSKTVSGMRIYLNGVGLSAINASSGTYTAMEAVSDRLYVGAKWDGSEEGDGYIGELAIWGKELTASEVATIYGGLFEQAYKITSGHMSLPNRVNLRDIDNLQGQYPVNKRTGDANRHGKFNVFFDDTDLIDFGITRSNISYPTLTVSNQTNPTHYTASYANPHNPTGGITTTGALIKGITDHTSHGSRGYKSLSSKKYVSEINSSGENLRPFDDSRVSLKTTDFYLTGTSPDVIPHFSSKLSDKTQVVIDLNNSQELVLSSSTLSGSNHPMGDYNFSSKKFEAIGSGWPLYNVSGMTFNLFGDNPVRDSLINYTVGFNPSSVGYYPSLVGTNGTTGEDLSITNFAGLPTSTYGFPQEPKFFANNDQRILMSNYISHPFVLEKIVFEGDLEYYARSVQSGVLKGPDPGSRVFPVRSSFNMFILKSERLRPDNKVLHRQIHTGSIYLSSVLNEPRNALYFQTSSQLPGFFRITNDNFFNNTSTYVDRTQSLVTFGKFEVLPFPEVTDHGWADMQFITQSSTTVEPSLGQYYDEWTNNIGRLEFNSKNALFYDKNVNPDGNAYKLGKFSITPPGGGSAHNFAFIGEFGINAAGTKELGYTSTKLIQEVNATKLSGSNTESYLPLIAKSSITGSSPSLIFPEDELIFGFQAGIASHRVAGSMGASSGKNKLTISAGSCKITLYGSLVKDKKEYHDTLNQHLTTEAVHDIIEEPVLDEFLVSSRYSYTGSYVDDNVLEVMSATERVGLNVASMVGAIDSPHSGSTQKFTRAKDTKERYYDTLLPDLVKMWKVDGFTPTTLDVASLAAGYETPITTIGVFDDPPNSGFATAFQPTLHSFWLKTFPFESRYSQASRMVDQSLMLVGYQVDQSIYSKNIHKTTSLVNVLHPRKFSLISPTVLGRPTQPSYVTNKDSKTLQRIGHQEVLFGFGNTASGSMEYLDYVAGFGTLLIQPRLARPVGYKYGIMNANPQCSSAVYRSDKFGQYAHMLEQRSFARTYNVLENKISESPVTITFCLDDDDNDRWVKLDEKFIHSNTRESSNLSIYATSSMPYFDDTTTRNRNYDALTLSDEYIDV